MASLGYSILNIQGSTLHKTGMSCLVIALIFHATLLVERNTEYRSNIVLWEDTVKKSPYQSRAWHNLSHFYLMELNYEKAFDSIQRLLKSNPSKHYLAIAHSKLGMIHSRKGELAKAIASYEEGIRINPSAPINHFNLGSAYMRQRKFSKARKAYEKAEQLFKSNPTYKNIPASLYLNKARTLFYLGRYELAEASVRTYKKMAPESKSADSLLRKINVTRNKPDQKPGK